MTLVIDANVVISALIAKSLESTSSC